MSRATGSPPLFLLIALAVPTGTRASSFLIEELHPEHPVSREVRCVVHPSGEVLIASAGRGLHLTSDGTGTWQVEDVRPHGCIAQYENQAIALDSSGEPGVVYHDYDELWFARRSGGVWQAELVDRLAPRDHFFWPSLAFDSADRPVISYHSGYGDLRVARWDGSGWVTTKVDEAAVRVGPYTSIAIDGDDHVFISYRHSSDGVKLARYDGSAWTAEVVAPDTYIDPTSLALDAAGNPLISYEGDGGTIYLATWTGTAWDVQSVADAGGGHHTLAIDRSGFPVIAYRQADASDLMVAYGDGTGWDFDLVDADEVTHKVDVAIAPSGYPVVAYYEQSRGEQRLARFDGSAWSTELVYTATGGSSGQIAIDSDDRPQVVYYGDGGLQVARHDGTAWSFEPVDVLEHGFKPAFALDAADRAIVAYQASSDNSLRLTRWTGTAWTNEVVDGPPVVLGSWRPSLALDSADAPVIAYTDTAIQRLKLARWTGSDWDVQVVDPTGVARRDASLALDSSDRPAIAYEADRKLKLARWSGVAWDIEVLDDSLDAGYNSAIAFDRDDNPLVAYDRGTREPGVALARWDGGAWQYELLPQAATPSELLLDADDNPIIGDVSAQPKYHRWDGAGWTETVIDAVRFAWMGMPSLAHDSRGAIHATYDSGCVGSQRVARQEAGRVRFATVTSFAPGWKGAALPLNDATDEDAAPFPIESFAGNRVEVPAAAAPLALYRFTLPGDDEGGGTLRIVKTGAGLELRH